MRLVKPSIEFMWMTEYPLLQIERAGRTCYKSEDRISADSAPVFVKMLLNRGHEAMLEHASASCRVICDRGVTHEIVRHRLFSYAQESTRYCNYKGGVEFIIPMWLYDHVKEGGYPGPFPKDSMEEAADFWCRSMSRAEIAYQQLIGKGWSPQQARSVLPNSLKTEIVITGNLREWRHFFKLRTAAAAHPQMREVAEMLLYSLNKRIPVVFDEFFTKAE